MALLDKSTQTTLKHFIKQPLAPFAISSTVGVGALIGATTLPLSASFAIPAVIGAIGYYKLKEPTEKLIKFICNGLVSLDAQINPTTGVKTVKATTTSNSHNGKLPSKVKEVLAKGVYFELDSKSKLLNLSTHAHGLIGGSTGMGKGVLLNHVITSLLTNKNNFKLDLTICDMKGGLDYPLFESLANVDLVIEEQEIVQVLNDAWATHNQRLKTLKETGFANIREFNAQYPRSLMKPHVIVIDEYSLLADNPDIKILVRNITALCRATGIHLIISTQHPLASVVSSTIKNNCTIKLSLKVADSSASRVLGFEGAKVEKPHNLGGIGQCLSLVDGASYRFSVPFTLNNERTNEILKARLAHLPRKIIESEV